MADTQRAAPGSARPGDAREGVGDRSPEGPGADVEGHCPTGRAAGGHGANVASRMRRGLLENPLDTNGSDGPSTARPLRKTPLMKDLDGSIRRALPYGFLEQPIIPGSSRLWPEAG